MIFVACPRPEALLGSRGGLSGQVPADRAQGEPQEGISPLRASSGIPAARGGPGLGYAFNFILTSLNRHRNIPDNFPDGQGYFLQVVAGRGGPLQVGVTLVSRSKDLVPAYARLTRYKYPPPERTDRRPFGTSGPAGSTRDPLNRSRTLLTLLFASKSKSNDSLVMENHHICPPTGSDWRQNRRGLLMEMGLLGLLRIFGRWPGGREEV